MAGALTPTRVRAFATARRAFVVFGATFAVPRYFTVSATLPDFVVTLLASLTRATPLVTFAVPTFFLPA